MIGQYSQLDHVFANLYGESNLASHCRQDFIHVISRRTAFIRFYSYPGIPFGYRGAGIAVETADKGIGDLGTDEK